MLTIKQARLVAGLTQKQMSDTFDIPLRTIESWESGVRKPPKYVERLIVEKLTQITKEKAEQE